MGFDLSVVVLTYYPDKNKLLSTIKSALLQKNISFEILIADDGSDNFFKEDIEKIMHEYNFTDFKFIEHSENQGTVVNFYDAVKVSQGKVIKPISPGDYFYDSNTLFNVYNFMNEQDADVAFGDLVYYFKDNVYNKLAPICDKPYFAYNNYNAKKIAKNLIKYSDCICGASIFYKASVLKNGLSKIAGTVIYAEDSVTQLFALEGKKILKTNDFVVFYEFGTGLSTNEPFANCRILDDFLRFYAFLKKEFPKNRHIDMAIKKLELIRHNKKIQYYLYRLFMLDNNIYSIRQKIILKKYRCVNYNRDFFNKVNEIAL